MRRLFLPLALLLVLPASAQAGAPKIVKRHLWSTVNICDTKRHPDAIGIRASMPGTGSRRQSMWMRFQVQYRRASDGRWRFLSNDGGDSGFVRIGRHADFKAREAGYIFRFKPRAGQRYVMRGLVTFQWRRRATNRVVRKEKELTSPGHNVDIADPKDFSRRQCVIERPPKD